MKNKFQVGLPVAQWDVRFGSVRSSRAAFTLIELLTVVTIISVVAGLVLAGAGAASKNAKLKMAEAQRDQLITFIDGYYARRNVYPPDNPVNPSNNPLFYELAGTTNANGRFSPPGGLSISAASVQPIFGMGGFINSFNPAGDAGDQPMLTFLKGLKDNQKMTVSNNINSYTALCVYLPSPYVSPPAPPAPWNYLIAPHATNNTTTYDLWVDVKLGGATYRISNWNKQSQRLN